MRRIYIDPELCQACKNCVLACMLQHSEAKSIHELNLTDQKNQSRNEIYKSIKGAIMPVFCRHCEDAECLNACMSGALSRDEATGMIQCDENQCAGCWMCVMACPYGMIKPNGAGKAATKCDFCGGSKKLKCVENCPTEAIRVIEVPEKGGDRR